MEYVVVIHPAAKGGYWAEVPSLPGCFAQGESVEDLLDAARNAIAAHIEALRADGQAIPVEDRVIIATVKVMDSAAA